jgi:glycosyltransferase involved in cell wall biosynthesis
MDAPLVSVVIATYNWSNVLRCAIRSALRQTFERIEVLVIGDGCSDDSAEVVASFEDPRLRWDNLPQNSGSQGIPNNRGIELARGKYIAYLGHDDLWYPTHLDHVVGALEAARGDVGHAMVLSIGPPGSSHLNVPKPLYQGRFLALPPSAAVHRRDLVDRIGGWKDYRAIRVTPDSDFFRRAYDRSDVKDVYVQELTVFKFPAVLRPNAYIRKPSTEQEEYLRRMDQEPDFQYRELIKLAVHIQQKPPTSGLAWPRLRRRAPGYSVARRRKLRGLDAQLPASTLADYWDFLKQILAITLPPILVHFIRQVRPARLGSRDTVY